MDTQQIAALIEAGLPSAEARVASPDGTHFSAIVICAAFNGKRSLQRHQMVYRALGDSMASDIHALSFKTYTPDEWAAADGQV